MANTGKSPLRLRVSDLRGLAQLATDATLGVSGVVEGVHQSVWSRLGVTARQPGRTRGLTGLVYRGVHAGARLVGRGTDLALRQWQSLQSGDRAADSAPRDALVSALNGVLGDHLRASGNPLALGMSLCQGGVELHPDLPVPLGAGSVSGRIVLLVHGLCMNDRQWQCTAMEDPGRLHDHGAVLATALDASAIYLRYNSGLHISDNGRQLAHLLERLFKAWPQAVSELWIVGHSMGGLVARSALLVAQEAQLHWPAQLAGMVFLGTPHHGAPLERAGGWIDTLLGSNRHTAPFAALGRLRSAGITDLRHGHVRDADWQGEDRFGHRADRRTPLPLPMQIPCYAIAATTSRQRDALGDHLSGDGLVPVRSALGEHAQARHRLNFAPENQWVAYGTGHLELLGSEAVARQMLVWLRG